MFKVDPAEIERLRSAGGDKFTAFVNDLIQAHSLSNQVPFADIVLNLKTTIGDGGVDAEVRSSSPNDALGILIQPTAWQFKATEARRSSPKALVSEIKKPYATNRVREGYGFFFCICASLTPEAIEDRREALAAATSEINPAAPAPQILDANRLAELAEFYPSVVVQHFYKSIQGHFLTVDRWGPSVARDTGSYYWTAASQQIRDRIAQHLDSSASPNEAILVVVSGPGGGKSRAIYESITNVAHASTLSVITTNENDALLVARTIVQGRKSAYLIIDSPMSNDKLRELRQFCIGHEAHIRILASAASPGPDSFPDSTLLHLRLSTQDVEAILKSNFPEMPNSYIRAYAHFAGSILSLAVAFCRSIPPSTKNIELPDGYIDWETVSRVIGPDSSSSSALQALSLLDATGWRDTAQVELKALCSLLGLLPNEIHQFAQRVGLRVSLLEERGDYWVVQPPAIARLAFSRAWMEWIAPDIKQFLAGLDAAALQIPFLRQVSEVGSDSIRRSIAEAYSRWFVECPVEAIWISSSLKQMLVLCEIAPERFLHIFQEKVTEAVAQASLASGKAEHSLNRETIFDILHTLRQLATRRDTFPIVIETLIRLLPLDDDQQTQPTVRSTLVRLFQIWLSGTPIPFLTRYEEIRSRLNTKNPNLASVIVESLCSALDTRQSRGIGHPIVGATIPEREWSPETYPVLNMCFDRALEGLTELVSIGSKEAQTQIWTTLAPNLDMLRRSVPLFRLFQLFPVEALPSPIRLKLIQVLREMLSTLEEADSEIDRDRYLGGDREIDIRSFLSKLRKGTLADDFALLMLIEGWRTWDVNGQWNKDAQPLASAIISNPSLIAEFCTDAFPQNPDAEHQLGIIIGIKDINLTLFYPMLESSRDHPERYIAAGYFSARNKDLNPVQCLEIDKAINFLTEHYIYAAFNLIRFAAPEIERIPRLVQLVGPGRIPPVALRVTRSSNLREEDITSILEILVSESEGGDATSAQLAIEFLITYKASAGHLLPLAELIESPGIQNLAIRLLRSSVEMRNIVDTWWGSILRALVLADRSSAIEIACKGLLSWEEGICTQSEETLICLLPGDDTRVMHALAQRVTAYGEDWRSAFPMYSHTRLFSAIPAETVIGWVEKAGPAGAYGLAPHLPQPFIARDGHPIVPELTDTILRYPQPNRVIEDFARSTISPNRLFVSLGSEEAAEREQKRQYVSRFAAWPNPGIQNWAREVMRQLDAHDDSDRELDVAFRNRVVRG